MTASNSSDRPPPSCENTSDRTDALAWGSPGLDHCYRRVVEQSPSSIVVTDTGGNILYVNPAFERQTGYSAAEAIGQNPRILNARTQPPDIYEELWDTISSGLEWSGRLQNKRKDGSLYWEKAVIAPIVDGNGKIIQFIAIKEDITALAEAEERNRWLGALVRISPDICAVRDLSDRILAVNDAFLRLCGKASPPEVIGHTDAEVFGLEPDSEVLTRFHAGLRTARELPPGGIHHGEIALGQHDREPIIFQCSYIPIHDERGRLLATATVAQDVTHDRSQSRELEAALERAKDASRAKSVFLGTVSHELRTPLNAIIGLASTLTEQNDLTMETRLSVEWIQRSGELLLAQIEGLLQFTRLQAGETRVARERFGLLECFTDALRCHHDGAQAQGLTLSHALDPRLPSHVVGDAGKLRRMLNNLLSNALKFTDHGSVHLAARRLSRPQGDWMRIEVVDTGIGIAAEALERIFEPFYQIDGTDTRRHGGAGLGLSITQGLAQALGGTIAVASEVGRGTRFTIELPLEEPSPTSLYAPVAHPRLRGKKVCQLTAEGWQRECLEAWLGASGARTCRLQPARLLQEGFEGSPRDVLMIDFSLVQDLPARILIALQRSTCPIIWLGSDQPMGRDRREATHYHLPLRWLPGDLHTACEALFGQKTTAPAGEASAPGAATQIAAELPLRILIADDLESNRTVVKVMLRHLGYDSDTAENGARALEAATSEEGYDVILMDLQMPVMDGFEATRRIRAHFGPDAGPRIVALTANAEDGVEERCREAGMDAYLAKPVTPPQIASTLRRLRSSSAPFKAPAESPPPCCEAAETTSIPILDEEHLRAFVGEMGNEAAMGLLEECRLSFARDCEAAFPRLREALNERRLETTIEIVHGLKGGSAMLGLARFRATCQETLEALRGGSFAGWDELYDELEFLSDRSFEALDYALTATAPLSTENP